MDTKLSRRDFLKLTGFVAAASGLWGCSRAADVLATPSPIPTADSPDPLTFAALTRITFGPRPEEVERASQIGLDNFIDEQLAWEAVDDPEVGARLAGLSTLEMSAPELAELEKRGQPATELMTAALLRAVYSRRGLYEQMVHFWTDHFNIYIGKNQDRILKTADDREVIRPHALGKFRDLLSASAHSPAMLVYLDNAASTKDGPNENYARELMELHTLGVDGGYTQTDVEEAARALTGWTVRRRTGEFFFDARIHDDGEKTILGAVFPAGQGIRDGEQLIEMLAVHPATARYIATKLVIRFVSDQPPASLVERAAAAFTQTDGDLVKVMSTILHSEEFRASLGGKLKRPFDFVVSALRQTSAETEADRAILYLLTQMGQRPFFWPAPNGYPEAGAAWLNSNDLLARWNFALGLVTGALRDTQVDLPSLASGAATVEAALDALSLRLLGGALTGVPRQYLLEALAGYSLDDALAPLAALLLAAPHFQIR
ncbi:MAG: DUF1800 family protein [Chloroflexota bacterium]